jgi:hypothetical protein
MTTTTPSANRASAASSGSPFSLRELTERPVIPWAEPLTRLWIKDSGYPLARRRWSV